jgi:class 3 adenylate cyclase
VHRTFKKLLPRASGHSEWVVAINADIRGFSSHMAGDPAVTALYLRRVYGAILRDYFRGASFFKPTGDGLLVIIPFPEGRQRLAIAERLVDDSLRLVESFPTITGEDPLLPRQLPRHLGVGLSVGSTSRIATGDVTLDYTGPALNIASRLMDLARPLGVVVDAALLPDSVPAGIASRFEQDGVYLKGVAESTPLAIRYTADIGTSIPERFRQPLVPLKPIEQRENLTVPEVRMRAPAYRHSLKALPADRKGIEVEVEYPDYKDGKRQTEDLVRIWSYTEHATFLLEGTRPRLRVDYAPLVNRLAKLKVPRTQSLEIVIRYQTDPSDSAT